ncbi:hypothetical protein HDK77DRAFT_216672 [Phyllosticta capitalensis]
MPLARHDTVLFLLLNLTGSGAKKTRHWRLYLRTKSPKDSTTLGSCTPQRHLRVHSPHHMFVLAVTTSAMARVLNKATRCCDATMRCLAVQNASSADVELTRQPNDSLTFGGLASMFHFTTGCQVTNHLPLTSEDGTALSKQISKLPFAAGAWRYCP